MPLRYARVPGHDARAEALSLAGGIAVERVAATGSTNDDLVARVRAAASSAPTPFPPCLLVADRQLAGRGRHGRVWQSVPDQSLTFSLAWQLERADLTGLSLAVGVAIADALEPPAAERGDLERDVEPVELRVPRKPGLGCPAQAALLLGADHFERVAEVVAALRLDLAEDELRSAADDHVELVPSCPRVHIEDPVAAQPVVKPDAALGGAAGGARAGHVYDASAVSTRRAASSAER